MEKEEEKLYIAKPKADKSQGFLSLAGAATSITFVATKVLLQYQRLHEHQLSYAPQ